jgi:hypothetical protein
MMENMRRGFMYYGYIYSSSFSGMVDIDVIIGNTEFPIIDRKIIISL